jgi:hypothetical protein
MEGRRDRGNVAYEMNVKMPMLARQLVGTHQKGEFAQPSESRFRPEGQRNSLTASS